MSLWDDYEADYYANILPTFIDIDRRICLAKDKVIVIRGTLDWAKVMGDARPHTGEARYDKGPYWSVDVTPDAKSLNLIKANDFTEKLRDPSPKDKQRVGTGKYLALKVLENKANGEKNKPPLIQDLQGQPWDNGLLGNGTVADVKVKVVDYGKSVQKGVYLQAIRVLSHVPYVVESFAPLSEDDEYFAADADVEESSNGSQMSLGSEVDDSDDDVPF